MILKNSLTECTGGQFSLGAKIIDIFPFTGDIHTIISRHVEAVVQLINQNAKVKHHMNIGVDAEDYYRIKDSE